MKIVSPFRDFYDRALAYGHDEHTVYVRKTEELYNSHDGVLRDVKTFSHLMLDFCMNDIRGHNDSTISFATIQILFCGKMYRGIQITSKPHWSRPGGDTRTDTYYDGDALINAVVNLGGVVDLDYKKSGRMWWGRKFFYENSLREWLAVQGDERYLEFAITNNLISVVIDGGAPNRVVNNPKLSDYDFFRAIDPVTAYQELDMFISGVLASAGKPMVVTEDKYRIQAAGFDKASFRKSPTKHR